MAKNNFSVNEEKNQFELDVDGEVAVIVYRLDGKVMSLLHTEVPPSLEGRGIGKELVEKTLNHIKKNDLKFEAGCSFVAAYVKRHPEWESSMASR